MRVCVKAATKTRKSERGTEFSIPLRILRVHCLIATPLPRIYTGPWQNRRQHRTTLDSPKLYKIE